MYMKTVLITGGSRGIGKATVEAFCKEGYRVITTSTNGTFSYDHENMITHAYDQSDPASIRAFIDWIKEDGYKIDVLVNNAGIMLDWKIDYVDMEILKKTFAVNLYGLIDFTEQLLEYISEQGLIVNLSSGLGALGADLGTLAPAYSITKAGVNMYTKKLQARIADSGRKVVAYEPGWVQTDMGGPEAPRTVDGPAADLLALATNPELTGGLFYNKDGVREW